MVCLCECHNNKGARLAVVLAICSRCVEQSTMVYVCPPVLCAFLDVA